MTIKKINEQLDKFVEEFKVIEKQTKQDGDELIFKVNKDSEWSNLYFALRKVSPKSIEEAKLLTEKDGYYLIEGRSATFRDLILFIYDGKNAKRVSPKQALEFLIGNKSETLFTVDKDFEYIKDEKGNTIRKPDGFFKTSYTYEITFNK